MKSNTVSTFSLSICYEVVGLDAMVFIFFFFAEFHVHLLTSRSLLVTYFILFFFHLFLLVGG